MPLPAHQRDLLAHAVNERLDEILVGARVPYSVPPPFLQQAGPQPTDADGSSTGTGLRVALVGLSPVYAHGLRTGLTATGLRCDVMRSGEDLPSPLSPGASVVAVVSRTDTLPLQPSSAATGEPVRPAWLAVVHVLPEESEDAYARALHLGATGAFPHDAELARVLHVVRCAGVGLSVLPRQVARALRRQPSGPRPQLEPRERAYLRGLADGRTVAGLARRHGHSEREMYRLLSSIYERLGAQNRTEALLHAQGLGLLADEP